MKVLQINAVCGVLSTGRTALELAEFLEKNGHECYVAYASGTTNYSKSYKISNKFGQKLHALLSRIFGKQAYYSTYSTKKLLKYINKINPDIIHLRNLHSNYINLNLLLKFISKNNIATALTLHDCWVYTGKCCHYTSIQCYKWMAVCERCPKKKSDNPSYFFDRSRKMFYDKKTGFENIKNLAVIGVSDWITNEAKKSLLSSAKIIKRIYNWIDLDVFKPTESDFRKKLNIQNKFVILGVASFFSKSKGLSDFLKLSKLIPKDFCIILVGRVNKPENLPENIINIPHTDSVSELVKYYSLADVFVSLSWEETFGKVIAEALSCGTPAIVYNVTACPELIGPNCGYVVEKDDIHGVANKIFDIYNMGKPNYSKWCIEFAKSKFEYRDNANRNLDVYKELIEGKG